MLKNISLVFITLVIAVSTDCPSCDNYNGPQSKVCGNDGNTYDNDCKLLIQLCKDKIISFGKDADVNTIPVSIIVNPHKLYDGPCQDGGDGSDNCPNCTSIVDTYPVCDTSLVQYNSSCIMAQQWCADGIISFDDATNFTLLNDTFYRKKMDNYVNWDGNCTGPCPAGRYSRSGNYGPCRKCGPGSFTNVTGSTACQLCEQDTYQPEPGSNSCIQCPDGTDTLDKGAKNVTECVKDCVAGHYSATGKAPCTKCPVGTWTNGTGAKVCLDCAAGSYSNESACISCPMGQYSDSKNSDSCKKCPMGSFSNQTGSNSCFTCGNGTFANETGMPACRMCGEGSYNDVSGAFSCKTCQPGTYQIELGKAFCFSCPQGTYQSASGANSCTSCPVSTYQDEEGKTSCISCPNGQVTTSTGSIYKSECRYSECGLGTKVVITSDGRLKCDACPEGTYQNLKNQTSCVKCPMDSYQDSEGASTCIRCPINHVTYSTGSKSESDCEGPEIILATGTNLQGTVVQLRDRRSQLPSSIKGKVRSFKVVRGSWYVFTASNYEGRRYKLDQGVRRNDVNSGSEQPRFNGLTNGMFQSIRPVVSQYMCYLEYGYKYSGYRTKSITGAPCRNWYQSSASWRNKYGIGNHNFCRNPDNDPNGPWCYIPGGWAYCGVPKCIWNIDCYTERGQYYRGTRTKTSGSSYNCNNWNSNFPHPHSYDSDYNKEHYGIGDHRYCRNPAPGGDDKPWCYTTYFFKRWAYCDVPKCEFGNYNYFSRRHARKR